MHVEGSKNNKVHKQAELKKIVGGWVRVDWRDGQEFS